jgi:hypothetical protein
MVEYNIKSIILCFSIILTLYTSPLFSQQEKNENLCFQWTFLLRNKEGNNIDFKSEDRIIELGSGDRMRIFLKPVRNAYIYFFLHDSQDRLFLLFPRNPFFEEDYMWGRSYHIPDSTNWLILDENHGIEKFILLVSTSRLNRLEELTKVYLISLSSQRSEAYIKEKKQNILDEIRDIKKQKSIFSEHNATPISIAGEIRGVKTEEELYALEISVENFYARTIRIRH